MSEVEQLRCALIQAISERDVLRVALADLLEHEGTVDQTAIGEMPSEALQVARRQAITALEKVKAPSSPSDPI